MFLLLTVLCWRIAGIFLFCFWKGVKSSKFIFVILAYGWCRILLTSESNSCFCLYLSFSFSEGLLCLVLEKPICVFLKVGELVVCDSEDYYSICCMGSLGSLRFKYSLRVSPIYSTWALPYCFSILMCLSSHCHAWRRWGSFENFGFRFGLPSYGCLTTINYSVEPCTPGKDKALFGSNLRNWPNCHFGAIRDEQRSA